MEVVRLAKGCFYAARIAGINPSFNTSLKVASAAKAWKWQGWLKAVFMPPAELGSILHLTFVLCELRSALSDIMIGEEWRYNDG